MLSKAKPPSKDQLPVKFLPEKRACDAGAGVHRALILRLRLLAPLRMTEC